MNEKTARKSQPVGGTNTQNSITSSTRCGRECAGPLWIYAGPLCCTGACGPPCRWRTDGGTHSRCEVVPGTWRSLPWSISPCVVSFVLRGHARILRCCLRRPSPVCIQGFARSEEHTSELQSL